MARLQEWAITSPSIHYPCELGLFYVDQWGYVQTDGSKISCRPLVYGFERAADLSSPSITIFWYRFRAIRVLLPTIPIETKFTIYQLMLWIPFTASKPDFEHPMAYRDRPGKCKAKQHNSLIYVMNEIQDISRANNSKLDLQNKLWGQRCH